MSKREVEVPSVAQPTLEKRWLPERSKKTRQQQPQQRKKKRQPQIRQRRRPQGREQSPACLFLQLAVPRSKVGESQGVTWMEAQRC